MKFRGILNDEIRHREVRLIDQNGTQVGIVSKENAIERAKEAGMDLVMVAPNVRPPVCKIIDFGKYRYELQKKEKSSKKNQKIVKIKEIKMRPFVAEADYTSKINMAKRFLSGGYKVKFNIFLSGRERSINDIGKDMIERISVDMRDAGDVEKTSGASGAMLYVIVVPKKS